MACQPQNQENQKVLIYKELSAEPTQSRFSRAHSLFIQGNLTQAEASYLKLLSSAGLIRPDSTYLYTQLAALYLMEDRLASAQPFIEKFDPWTLRLRPPVDHYLRARWHFLRFENQDALEQAREAEKWLRNNGKIHDQLYLRSLDLLALIHYENDLLTDSTAYYARRSQRWYLEHPGQEGEGGESEFVQACASFLYRAYRRGELYCRRALQKESGSSLLQARAHALLANFLKKQGDARASQGFEFEEKALELYQEADSPCLGRALEIIGEAHPQRKREFLRDRVILASRFHNETLFHFYLEALEAHDHPPRRFGFADRLRGYHYFIQGKFDAAETFYIHFLDQHRDEPLLDPHLIDEAYSILRSISLKRGEYDQALSYAQKVSDYYGCRSSGLRYDRSRSLCVVNQFAQLRIEVSQLQQSKRVKREDLSLLNDRYKKLILDFYSSIQNPDEDAFLTYQGEVGRRMCQEALQLAVQGWRETRDEAYLDLTFFYMEQMKSLLLFRQGVKALRPLQDQRSRADSLHYYQGEVIRQRYRFKHGGQMKRLRGWEEAQAMLNRFANSLTFDLEKNFVDRAFSLQDVQQGLNSDEAVISYSRGTTSFFALCLTKEKRHLFEIKTQVDGEKLEETLANFRASLDRVHYPTSLKATYLRSAARLYDKPDLTFSRIS